MCCSQFQDEDSLQKKSFVIFGEQDLVGSIWQDKKPKKQETSVNQVKQIQILVLFVQNQWIIGSYSNWLQDIKEITYKRKGINLKTKGFMWFLSIGRLPIYICQYFICWLYYICQLPGSTIFVSCLTIIFASCQALLYLSAAWLYYICQLPDYYNFQLPDYYICQLPGSIIFVSCQALLYLSDARLFYICQLPGSSIFVNCLALLYLSTAWSIYTWLY